MLEQYKLDFATYLESLSPEKKEEELLASQRRKKPSAGQTPRKRRAKKEKDDDEDEVESSEEEEEEEEEEELPPTVKAKKVLSINIMKVIFVLISCDGSLQNNTKAKKVNVETDENPPMKLFKGEPEPPPVYVKILDLTGIDSCWNPTFPQPSSMQDVTSYPSTSVDVSDITYPCSQEFHPYPTPSLYPCVVHVPNK
jgi:hypothetical protein